MPVLDPGLRHMPLRTLSLFAQRAGKVFVSVTTWARLVRVHGWRRPRVRMHPAKPTVGVRASRPNDYWHIDVTVLRLLDGTKTFLHAVIDNYSRKILAWTLAPRLDSTTTCQVLVAAGQHLADKEREPADACPTVVADAGVENVNGAVEATLASAKLRRVLAQVEVTYSNSIIEAWWRSLKHQWLFLNTLDTMAHLQALVAFFVEEQNAKMPHSAFAGQTPDEMYLGTAKNLPDELVVARAKARERRLAVNRAVSCHRCARLPATPRHHHRMLRDCRGVAVANARLHNFSARSTAPNSDLVSDVCFGSAAGPENGGGVTPPSSLPERAADSGASGSSASPGAAGSGGCQVGMEETTTGGGREKRQAAKGNVPPRTLAPQAELEEIRRSRRVSIRIV